MKKSGIGRPQNRFDDYEDDIEDDFDAELNDAFGDDLDDDGFTRSLEPNEVRPSVRQERESTRSPLRRSTASQRLPHDWADFDYGGSDDSFDSNWR